MEIPDRLFETILLAVRDAAEEVENGNLMVTDASPLNSRFLLLLPHLGQKK